MASTRKVVQGQQKVTVLTDVVLNDHSDYDKYFQFVYQPGAKILEWRNMLKDRDIRLKCDVVWIMIGQAELPIKGEFSLTNQMKKLVHDLTNYAGRKLRHIYIGVVLPRPDKEVEWENNIRDLNEGFALAARDLRRHGQRTRNVTWMPLQHLVLERYKYFESNQGHVVSYLRIVKAVDRYFQKVGEEYKLNAVGLQHVRAYFLKAAGFLTGVSMW